MRIRDWSSDVCSSDLMESSTYLTGQFLLAMPGIGDPRFERAVIAVCAHDSEGAIGIGLGARIEGLGFHDLLGQLDIAPGEAPAVPVHFGGPLEPPTGCLVHAKAGGGRDKNGGGGRD